MRKLPENNLSIPILIKFDTGSSGSGFNVITKDHLYLVTARHVLSDNTGNLLGKSIELVAYSDDLNDKTPTVINLNCEKLTANGNVILHPEKDVAVIKIGNADGNNSFQLVEGVEAVSVSKTGIVWTNSNQLLSYDKVLISNSVYIFGYPSSIGMQNSPQFDYNRPLIRKGIVASKYEQANTIILDCPVYYGNSGGAVIQEEILENGDRNFNIIGVVSQFVPYVENWVNNRNGLVNTTILNSGYSVAVSIDTVLELLT